jgi:pSer/pThr/pTyr-binding forkhead associated (FHA) protein
MAIFIKHIEGSKTGQLESFDQDQIRIGRQSDNEISFDPQKDASVSGYHAEIYRDGDVFFIKDLQSRNGTFVNSRKINQPVLLKEGDILQFFARGPKVVFSTSDPSVDSSTSFAESPGGRAHASFHNRRKRNAGEKSQRVGESTTRTPHYVGGFGAIGVRGYWV